MDVKYLKELIPGVRLATRVFPNLKMSKNRFFFIIRYLIRRIFQIIFIGAKTVDFILFSSLNDDFYVYRPFRPTKYRKTKTACV